MVLLGTNDSRRCIADWLSVDLAVEGGVTYRLKAEDESRVTIERDRANDQDILSDACLPKIRTLLLRNEQERVVLN